MKRFSIALVVLFVSTALLWSNGTQEQSSEEVVKLTITTWDPPSGLAVTQAVTDEFMAKNPGIEVEWQSTPQGYDDKVLVAHAAGDTPDMLMMWNTPLYVEAGVVADLTPFVERDNWDMSQYNPVTALWAEYKGGIWGLPKDYTPRAIFYNKNVFDEAGLPYPQDGWTFADFTETVKSLTNGKSGAEARYGYVAIPGHTYAMQAYIWANGGDLCSPDGMTASGYINSKEVAEVVSWYKELFDLSMSTGTMDAIQNLGQTEFQSGIVGMMDNGMWPCTTFQNDSSLRFGVVAQPVPNKGDDLTPIIHSSTYSMFAEAKNKEAAWKFLKYIGGPEGSLAMGKAKYGIPAVSSMVKPSGILEDEHLKVFAEIGAKASIAPVFTRNPNWFEADGVFQKALESIFLADAEIQPTLDEAAVKMDKILQQ